MRHLKRSSCSSSEIENQYLISWMPERTSIRSNSGTVRKNSSYCSSVQKPITRSTPARLYQLRSNSTISPAAGRCVDVALEVPLRALAVVGRGQRGDAAHARVEPLGDALDHAALAGRVAALEEDHELVAAVDDPVLQLDELALQPEQLLEIVKPPRAVLRRFGGSSGQLHALRDLGRHAVVELHLELFVEAVERILVDPAERFVVAGCIQGHGVSLRTRSRGGHPSGAAARPSLS